MKSLDVKTQEIIAGKEEFEAPIINAGDRRYLVLDVGKAEEEIPLEGFEGIKRRCMSFEKDTWPKPCFNIVIEYRTQYFKVENWWKVFLKKDNTFDYIDFPRTLNFDLLDKNYEETIEKDALLADKEILKKALVDGSPQKLDAVKDNEREYIKEAIAIFFKGSKIPKLKTLITSAKVFI